MQDQLFDALYARQSVEKKDSISVESQLEYCRYEARGEACLEYTDRGFSGGNINRPGFERMMRDIRAGKIKRVIVYKLDRISRSILDFANMMELFQQYHVEFVSSTEKFDTSAPIGRAMLNICIVFAQLERETIQKRVTDAYYARCRRGFYMGGRIPYGYRLTGTVIDRIRTSMYEEVPEESGQLKLIYSLYADTDNSLGDIVRYLNMHGIKHLRGAEWNTARLSELLRNPVYVQADIEIYRFFKSQGAHIYNSAGDFTGGNACYLYKSSANGTDIPEGISRTASRSCLAGKEVVLAPHRGFIPSGVWLACRKRSINSRQAAGGCRPKNSWLSGKIKCGRCGCAMVIRRAKTKWGRYFVCSRAGKQGSCTGAGCTVYADVLEEYMLGAIGERLSEFPVLQENRLCGKTVQEMEPERLAAKIRITQLEEEIGGLLDRVSGADSILLRYMNERIRQLDEERKALQEEVASGDREAAGSKGGRITDHVRAWEAPEFPDRRAVAEVLIRIIRIADGRLEIIWNI